MFYHVLKIELSLTLMLLNRYLTTIRQKLLALSLEMTSEVHSRSSEVKNCNLI